MALCLTFYMAFLIQTPLDSSRLSEDVSAVCTILHSINWGLNACSTIFLYNLILQLLNIFSYIYWTVLTTTIRRSLSSGRRAKSTHTRTPFLSDRFQRCLSFNVRFLHGLPTSEFPTIISYEFLISHLPTIHHTHHIFLDFIGLMFGKEMPTNCKASQCWCLCSFFNLVSLPFTLDIQTIVYKPKYYQQVQAHSFTIQKPNLPCGNEIEKTSKSPTMNIHTYIHIYIHKHSGYVLIVPIGRTYASCAETDFATAPSHNPHWPYN
jgi:hypothetical protein